MILLALVTLFIPRTAHSQNDSPASDTLLVTPTTQGMFVLPQTGVTLEIGYATVTGATHLSVTRQRSGYMFAATDTYGVPVARFETPLVATFPPEGESAGPVTLVIGWPTDITLPPAVGDSGAPDAGRWLVVFDAHGIYAQPAWAALPDSIVYLGPLEHYAPELIDHDLDRQTLRYAISPPIERTIHRIETRNGQTTITELPTAAHAARYADRFIPEDRGNPGGFMLLGWVRADQLPDVARALRATIPDDPDLPAPGVPHAPIPLILPFDCTLDWAISWGYHHSTPQNRFAIDFATADVPNGALGQPVYAAHAGTLYLKRYGTPDHLVDVGLSARVLAADGITSTVYGHLDPPGTFALWNLESDALPDFEWIEIGDVAQGQVIGVAGRTGYATGAHIHFVLWAWDQSLYQPIPLGSLTDFPRGRRIPAESRQGCDVYRR